MFTIIWSIPVVDQFMRINARDPRPIFKQISDALRQDIVQGALQAHTAIPSEREYAEQLKVSRMTVRAAINELVQEGLLVRSPGRATVVAPSKMNKSALGFMSFTEDMQARGMKASSQMLKCAEEMADAAVSAQLGLQPGARIIRIERVRLADQEPIALESICVPQHRFPTLIHCDLTKHSVYDLMEHEFGSRPSIADESIEAIQLSATEAKLLHIKPGSCALLARRVTRDTAGNLIEVAKAIYRGDRYRMVFTRQR